MSFSGKNGDILIYKTSLGAHPETEKYSDEAEKLLPRAAFFIVAKKMSAKDFCQQFKKNLLDENATHNLYWLLEPNQTSDHNFLMNQKLIDELCR